jgi:hypothetical protein
MSKNSCFARNKISSLRPLKGCCQDEVPRSVKEHDARERCHRVTPKLSRPYLLPTLRYGKCRTDIPGPTTQAGTGPTTVWAPGTTRLVLHGARQRGAQGNQRASTWMGS